MNVFTAAPGPTNLGAKPHYAILDGLRGVAALMVVAFHLFEAHATSHLDQIINHGYLAVDFFFLLSGFVIGYAYDDRWSQMSLGNFFKRRLIRLQPMVVFGMVVGALCFYFQDSAMWPEIHQVPVWKTFLVMIVGFTLIPLPPSLDIRGWGEMHALNGPGWSLFFEYIANILYAVCVRHFSRLLLGLLVAASAVFLIHLAVTSPNGDIIGGWSITSEQLHIGFARLLYPFFAGLLLYRTVSVARIKNGFLLCSLLLVLALAFPRIGGTDNLWANGLYDSLVVILVFPVIVYLGASGKTESALGAKVCKFLGDISYPIYITHYPLVYIYIGWVASEKIPMSQSWPVAVLIFLSCIALAFLSLRLYDIPVRKWLSRVFT